MQTRVYLILSLALAALIFGAPNIAARMSIAASRRMMRRAEHSRPATTGIGFFIPRITAKLRWGRAAIFEKVVEVYGYSPGAKTAATGTIMWIAKNTHNALLPHFPPDEICLLIDYDAGSSDRDGRSWQPADAYIRSTEGEHDGRVIRIR